MRAQGVGFGTSLLEASLRRGRRRFGSYVVHAGAAIVIVAIAVSSTMGVSKEVQLRRGESTELGAYTLTFVQAEELEEPHRTALVARIDVSRDGKSLGTLSPAMNQYRRQREPIGTPAVRSFVTGDLYLSILNIDPAGGRLGLLAMLNPMVGWIWAATGLMGLGGILTLVPVGRPKTLGVKPAEVVSKADEGVVTGTSS